MCNFDKVFDTWDAKTCIQKKRTSIDIHNLGFDM